MDAVKKKNICLTKRPLFATVIISWSFLRLGIPANMQKKAFKIKDLRSHSNYEPDGLSKFFLYLQVRTHW